MKEEEASIVINLRHLEDLSCYNWSLTEHNQITGRFATRRWKSADTDRVAGSARFRDFQVRRSAWEFLSRVGDPRVEAVCSQPCLGVGSPGPLGVNWSQAELRAADASYCQVRENQVLHKMRYLELFKRGELVSWVGWWGGYLRIIGRNRIIFNEVLLFARFRLDTFLYTLIQSFWVRLCWGGGLNFY